MPKDSKRSEDFALAKLEIVHLGVPVLPVELRFEHLLTHLSDLLRVTVLLTFLRESLQLGQVQGRDVLRADFQYLFEQVLLNGLHLSRL